MKYNMFINIAYMLRMYIFYGKIEYVYIQYENMKV